MEREREAADSERASLAALMTSFVRPSQVVSFEALRSFERNQSGML